jgi:hypothetical protein
MPRIAVLAERHSKRSFSCLQLKCQSVGPPAILMIEVNIIPFKLELLVTHSCRVFEFLHIPQTHDSSI